MRTKIEIIQGDTFEADVTVVNQQDEPVSLEGATILWTVATKDRPRQAVITKTETDPAINFTDRAAGKFSLRLDETETDELPEGEYFHTIRVKLANGARKTVVREYISVSASM